VLGAEQFAPQGQHFLIFGMGLAPPAFIPEGQCQVMAGIQGVTITIPKYALVQERNFVVPRCRLGVQARCLKVLRGQMS